LIFYRYRAKAIIHHKTLANTYFLQWIDGFSTKEGEQAGQISSKT